MPGLVATYPLELTNTARLQTTECHITGLGAPCTPGDPTIGQGVLEQTLLHRPGVNLTALTWHQMPSTRWRMRKLKQNTGHAGGKS